jgi:predicted O-methyltransferase YrrM
MWSRDTRLTPTIADGLQCLQPQSEASFDLVFADAMPGKYEGLEHARAV